MRWLPLAAVLLGLPSFAAPSFAEDAAGAERAFQEARASFLSHEAGTPTVDAKTVLPLGGRAQALKMVLESAREIQLGCVLPCSRPEDALVYRGKVEMVSSMLGVTDDKLQAAVARYLPGGKPRLRSPGAPVAPPPAGDRLIEGKVLERLLSDGRLAGQTRERLNQKALAFADALGRTQVIEDGGATSASAGSAASRGLTAAQMKALNGLPSAQSAILRDLAAKPPPPPPSVVRAESPAPADGLITNAKAHWDRIGEDPATGTAMRATAATMVSLFKVFNLDGFENSAFRLSQSASDPSVSRAQALKDGAAVAGNGALAVSGFLPASAWAKLASATKLSAVGEWIGSGAKMFRANPAIAERAAALQSKALTTPLTREEAAWLGEATDGNGGVIFHGTNDVDKIVASGRVAATTERFVYGARKEVNTIFRQLKAGVAPKDGTVIFQGNAAKLFSSHEATGAYSGLKKLAGQMTTNGAGDIVITKAVYNAETKTLSILEARMVTQGERRFILRSEGWSTAKLWGRRVVLDPAISSAAGFVAADAHAKANDRNVFEYILPSGSLREAPETASR